MRFFGTTAVALGGAAAIAAAAPAMADGRDPGTKAEPSAPTEAAETPTTAKKTKQRYCIVYQLTGSRIDRKECKTRDEWAAEGVDIPKQ